MGQENSKINYSGEGPQLSKYLPGLKEAASKIEWESGIVLNFGVLDPLITIAVETIADGKEARDIPKKYYSHILRMEHRMNDAAVITAVYLRQVTKKEAEEYMSIRKPPVPPPQPNFKYPQPRPTKKGSGERSDKQSDEQLNEIHDITSAIDIAVTMADAGEGQT